MADLIISGTPTAAPPVVVSGEPIITVAQLQAMPGINTASYTDAQLSTAISAAQSLIESYCDRIFTRQSYHEWLDGDGGEIIRLRNWPVVISRLSATFGDVATIGTSASCDSFDVSISAGVLTVTINGGASAGATSYTLASYTTLAALKTAVDVAPLTMSVTLECSPESLRPGIYGGDKYGGSVYLQGPWQDATAYTVQPETGILKAGRWPSGCGSVYCHYTAGYATAPADLQLVCAQVAMDSADMSMSNITSEKIGNVTYSYGPRGIYGLLAGHESVLNKYRRLI